RTVHICQDRNAHLPGCIHERLCGGMWVVGGADMYRSAHASPFVRAALPILDCLEDRQNVMKAPPVTAVVGPIVEVLCQTSHPQHGVDTGPAAEHMPHRDGDGPAANVSGGGRLEVPVQRATDVG